MPETNGNNKKDRSINGSLNNDEIKGLTNILQKDKKIYIL